MKFLKLFITLLSLFIIIFLLSTHAFGLDNGYARIVYNVSGLQDYQLHWNDRFPPGSTLMIYAEADGINHRRAVGVDYVFIVRDSNNNIVNTKVFENRNKSYKENDFVQYTQDIDEEWEDGAYVAEVHIFDLLNDSIMDDHYKNVSEILLNGEEICHENNDNNNDNDNGCDSVKNEEPDIPYMDRSDIRKSKELMDRQYKQIIQHFYIDRYANKYPANRFIVDKISLDRENIAPGMPIQVNISIKNTFYDSGSVDMYMILDNKSIDINNLINNEINNLNNNNLIFEIEPYSSKDIVLTIPSEITQFLDYGNHLLEIKTNSSNTAIFDNQKSFVVSETEIGIPARFYYKDIQTDKFIIQPNENVNITVTVENKGREGINNIGILINNVLTDEKAIHLNFLETKDINFTFTSKEPGEYKVTINETNLSKVFFVGMEGEINETLNRNITEGKTGQKVRTAEEKRTSSALIISGLSILVILIYIIRKKIIARGLK